MTYGTQINLFGKAITMFFATLTLALAEQQRMEYAVGYPCRTIGASR